ncbi:MAG TPA: ABC transporter permease [Candidatus Methylomirabilis sp.]|nr:ABC transporter permease [Candidatus Methylomirabilis sp.]
MQTLLQDLRLGLRVLAKSPGFTIVAVLTLALGIGANSAIFSVVNAVLLRPLTYTDSVSLVNVWSKFEKDGIPQNWISEPEYWDLLQHNESFSQIAAFSLGGRANLTRADGPPVQVSEASATAGLLPMLGVTPILGRTFAADEDQPGHSQYALLSYALWQSQFAGDPNTLSKSVQLDGVSYSIVGVLPKQFSLGGKQDLWIPLGLDRARPNNRGSHYLHVVARLKPATNSAQVSSALVRLAGDLRRTYPNFYGPAAENFDMYTVPVKDQLVSRLRPALFVLLGAVAFVLLIACANVANLLLVRASGREKELAIRTALGAGRARLIQQLLTESVLLASAGGLLGLGLAYWGVAALRAIVPANIPRMNEVHLDPAVLAFTFGVSLLAGVLFGLAPSLHITRADLRETLNESGRGTSAGGRSRFLRASLVVSELAISVLLLAGAGLLIRSFTRLLAVSPGFQTQHLLTMELSLPERTYPDGPPVQKFFAQLMASLKTLPGVQSVGAISEMPLADSYSSGSVFFQDTSIQDTPKLQALGNLPYMEIDQRSATTGYFQTMQIPLVRGRLFTEADDADAPLVVIVDTNFAYRFWPHGDAIGQHVAVDTIPNGNPNTPRWRTIVGVVGHVKHYSLDVEGREQIYFPHRQPEFGVSVPRDMTLAARTSMDPASVTSAIREQVAALDKDLALYNVATMDELVSTSVAQPRLNLSLLGAFAILALILAAIGVYGVMAYAVTQRTQEFGIRMALGATSSDVLKQVFLEGGRLAILGLALGLIAALGLTQLMSSLLFGVQPRDPVTFIAAAALLALVALAACYIPARRATRVDPLVALRYE